MDETQHENEQEPSSQPTNAGAPNQIPIDQKAQETIEERIKNDKARVIESAKNTVSITSAAAKAGIGRSTVYTWEKNDPEFKKQLQEALLFKLETIRDGALIKLNNYMVSGESDLDWRGQLSMIRYAEARMEKINKDQTASEIDEDLDTQALEALGEVLIAASKKIKEK